APFIMPTREVLEDARFLAAESAGRALSYDEAIAEARSWLEQHSLLPVIRLSRPTLSQQRPSGPADQIVDQKRYGTYGCDRTESLVDEWNSITVVSVETHLSVGGCFRDIFASLPNVFSWPSAAVQAIRASDR